MVKIIKRVDESKYKRLLLITFLSLVVAVSSCMYALKSNNKPNAPIEEPPPTPLNVSAISIAYDAKYPDFGNSEELVDKSDLILSGKVTKIEREMIDIASSDNDSLELPYLIYTFEDLR